MTAFAGPRIAARPEARLVRPAVTALRVREGLQGLRGAVRAATAVHGGHYTDALLLGRS